MSLLIAGSIATDHLMTYTGKFADSLVVEELDKLTLSFLVEDLEIRRGGCGPNICFGLGALGVTPVLVGAAGEDFGEYRSWLEDHGVDCESVRISADKHTARFVCTTDSTMAQFGSFYSGAMSEAREIGIGAIVERVGDPSYVLIGPDDPEGMLRHTEECRERGFPFVADPGQQLAFSGGELIRGLVDGAAILCSNEYESHLIAQKTGWSEAEILDRVGMQVVTLGKDGVRIERKAMPAIEVKACLVEAVEPTGVGDAFRAGFLAALSWELELERAAQVGSTLASYVVETVGTQEYAFTAEAFLERFRTTYGDDAADQIGSWLS